MFSDEVIREELSHGFKIPPKPQILQEIQDMVQQPDFSIVDLAEPLSQDIALSSAVLQLVNSASNGLNRTICDISQAVCFLGVDQLKAIIASIKMREAYASKSTMTLDRFWDESAETAQMMLFINRWLGKKYQPDSLYTIGLFHDCGIAGMSFRYDDYFDTYMMAKDASDMSLCDLENSRYSTDHATVGFYITSSWHFPKSICQLIRYHHDIEFKFSEEDRPYIAILHLAENILNEKKRFEVNQIFKKQLPVFLSWLELSDEEYADLVDDIESSLDN